MSVNPGTLVALRDSGNWTALYLVASYLRTVDPHSYYLYSLYTLWAVVCEPGMQTPAALTELIAQHEEYKRRINLLLENGDPLPFDYCIPYIAIFTVFCLETCLPQLDEACSSTPVENAYKTISQQLSFASVIFTVVKTQLQDENSVLLKNGDIILIIATWVSNCMLYISEQLLQIACHKYINTTQSSVTLYLAQYAASLTTYNTPNGLLSCADSPDKKSMVTQSPSLTIPDFVVRCEDLFNIALDVRNLSFLALRNLQRDIPLHLQLIEFLFWKPGESFEDSVQNAKSIYRRLQTLTALSLSQTSTSGGTFISPEHLQCNDLEIISYYNIDQLVAAQVSCIKALRLLEVAPMQPARPTEVKKLQRLFLSAFRVIQAHDQQKTTSKLVYTKAPLSLLARLAGLDELRPLYLKDQLLSSFYCAVMNYYCSTPSRDLYDIILSTQRKSSEINYQILQDIDIEAAISSIQEYTNILMKTIDTCVGNFCLSIPTNELVDLHSTDLIYYLTRCTIGIYGLLLCIGCRAHPVSDLLTYTTSVLSLLYYYSEILPLLQPSVSTFTQLSLLRNLTYNMRRVILELFDIYIRLLKLQNPVAQMQTPLFQMRISALITEKTKKKSHSNAQFQMQKAMQEVTVFISNRSSISNQFAFSFSLLAKAVSFSIREDPSNASSYEPLRCLCLYLLAGTPICLADYIDTVETLNDLKTNFIINQNQDLLLSANSGLLMKVDCQNIITNYVKSTNDFHTALEESYLELLLALTLNYKELIDERQGLGS